MSLHIFEARNVTPLVKEFYDKTWKTTYETKKTFEQIGVGLTKYGFSNVPILRENLKRIKRAYAAPVARAGCGLFRPSVVELLKRGFRKYNLPFEVFGLGVSRPHEADKLSANVYWNTLKDIGEVDLSHSLIVIYEMGEATGSTVEGIVKELKSYKMKTENLIFFAGAACIEQSKKRLEPVAPGMSLIVGSKWRYIEDAGPTQFYLNKMFVDGDWTELLPRDWGKCVSGMKDEESVKAFITWIGETIKISKTDREMLYKRWLKKINK